MTFIWIHMLWLLIAVPLLAIFYLFLIRRKKKSAVRYASLGIVKDSLTAGMRFRRHIPPLLFLFALTVLIFAVARPAAIVTLPSQRGTVILAMDISGSMRAGDIPPSRIDAAQVAAQDFIDAQPRNVRIGIVAFAATATVVQAPTLERSDVLAAIGRFRLQYGTAVGGGILTSLQAIFEDSDFDSSLPPSDFSQERRGRPLGSAPLPERRTPPRVPSGTYSSAVIVLLTDGQTNTGPDPLEAAERAAEMGVRVFTVGLGTSEGEILGFGGRSMRVQLDEEALRTISERTGGEYFRAESATELKRVYQALSTKFVMEKEKTEITAIFAAFAGVLMLISALLSLLWFGRIT